MRVRPPLSAEFPRSSRKLPPSCSNFTKLFLPLFLRIFFSIFVIVLILDLAFSNMSVRRSMNRWEGRRPRTEAFLETDPNRERERVVETRRDVGRFRNDITTRVKWRGKLAQLLMDIAEKARQVLPEAGDRGGGGETRPIREKFSSRRIASRAVSRFVAKP